MGGFIALSCNKNLNLTFVYQGKNIGKGGIDLTPSDDRAAPEAPPQFQFNNPDESPESLSNKPSSIANASSAAEPLSSAQPSPAGKKPMPRETGHDIGMGSPVPLSAEAVQVITRLRNMKVNY